MFNLEVANYISLPSLSKQVFLKMTGVELDYVQDIEMALFLKKGVRGGVSYVCPRHAHSTETESVVYLDQNNLYGR